MKRCCIVVLDNGRIVGKDPDTGTSHGHLCMEPAKVTELEGQRRIVKGKEKSVDGRVKPKRNVLADRPGPSGTVILSPLDSRATKHSICFYEFRQPRIGMVFCYNALVLKCKNFKTF